MPDEAALARWVRTEQECLWSDLEVDIRCSANGVWSVGAEWSAWRVVSAARLVGPTQWGAIPWDLMAGGIYAALLKRAGVEPDLPDEAAWASTQAAMLRQGLRSVEEAGRFFRLTIREIEKLDFDEEDE